MKHVYKMVMLGMCLFVYMGVDARAETNREELASGIEVNYNHDRRTLFQAAESGDLKFVELYLEEGGTANLSMPHGGSLLYYAVRGKRLDVVRTLLDHGADPASTHQTLGKTVVQLLERLAGDTLLEPDNVSRDIKDAIEEGLAKRKAIEDAVQLCLSAPWKIGGGIPLADMLYLNYKTIKAILEEAIKAHDVEYVKIFLDEHPSPLPLSLQFLNEFRKDLTEAEEARVNEAIQRRQNRDFYFDVSWKIKQKVIATTKEAKENLARGDIDFQFLGSGQTLLMQAAATGNLALCALLIENGANPDIKDKEGRTARDLVCTRWGSSEECAAVKEILTKAMAVNRVAD